MSLRSLIAKTLEEANYPRDICKECSYVIESKNYDGLCAVCHTDKMLKERGVEIQKLNTVIRTKKKEINVLLQDNIKLRKSVRALAKLAGRKAEDYL